jgi:hypothetical protein
VSNDLLRDAGRAAGIEDEQIEAMRAYLRSQDAYVTVNYEARYRREREAAKVRATEDAEAMPDYHGQIARCQAQVIRGGRVTEFDRCGRKPVKVRRIRDVYGSFKGDGRLAVCRQHAKLQPEPSRWVKGDHWMNRGRPETADEVVEAEYQP